MGKANRMHVWQRACGRFAGVLSKSIVNQIKYSRHQSKYQHITQTCPRVIPVQVQQVCCQIVHADKYIYPRYASAQHSLPCTNFPTYRLSHQHINIYSRPNLYPLCWPQLLRIVQQCSWLLYALDTVHVSPDICTSEIVRALCFSLSLYLVWIKYEARGKPTALERNI